MKSGHEPSDVSRALTSMVRNIPGVVITSKLHSTNFTIQRKVFAFTKGDGIVLKLPPAIVSRLLMERKAALLVMGQRTMKEWVVIHYKSAGQCRGDFALFKQSMEYVTK